jgi:zinc protease
MTAHFRRLLPPLTAALLMAAALTGCFERNAGPPEVKLDFEKYTLPNGLEVLLRKDSRLPIVAVNVWYHVGPAKETAGRTGFAHLFEHMMFQGSGHVGADMHFKYLEGAGASFVNGTTNFDRTNYLEDLPSNQLELALWLESDRMGFLLDRLDQPMLSNQQDVVRNERRQSIENQPYGLASEAVYQQLFPKDHPYYAAVIGSHADIQAAQLTDVRDFFSSYYAPNNATLAVVGDIDIAKTKQMIEKYFATLPKGKPVEPVTVTTPPVTSERRLTLTDQVELPRIYLAWITAPQFKPGDAEAEVAARIIGGGKPSRLYKALVYDRKIAQDVTASQESAALGSIFQIMVTAKPGHTVEELQTAIDHELDSLATGGPSADELQAAKNAIHTGIITSLENVRGVADRLQTYNHYVKDPGWLNQDIARYSNVTANSVRDLVKNDLAKNKRTVIEVLPGPKVLPPAPPTPKPTQATAAAIDSKEPWRNEVPKPGELSTAPLPAASTFQLANGLKVYLVENHALPIVAAQMVVRAGSSADATGKYGLAGFTAAMLDEGTKTRDALTIARDVERLGATLGVGVGRDGSTIGTRALKQNAEPALGIMAEVVQNPTFPEQEVQRVRNDRLTSLLQDRDSPFRIAATVMWTDLYGSDAPYGHMAIGNEPGLQAITADDLKRFHTTAYTPSNAALILSGELTASEARRLAARAFGDWKGGPAPATPAARGTGAAERVLVVDKPGMPQTSLMVAQVGIARSDPDYEKLSVMNQVLGGLFSSRINMNLREAHGYTYGAGSSFYDNATPGPFMISSDVRADVTGPAVQEILKETKGMLEKEVSEDELKLAKQSITRALPALFENNQSVAATIGDLYLYGLPPDYYEGLPKRIDGMTPGEVFAATQAHIKPDAMKVIAIGDRRIIDAQVGALKLGAIGYRLPDGRPVSAAAQPEHPLP